MHRRLSLAAVAVGLAPFFACLSSPAQRAVPALIHGVTVDNSSDIRDPQYREKLLASLKHISVTPTIRLVYTPGDKKGFIPAKSYLDATTQIRVVGSVMGQPVDSFYMKCFTPAEHLSRFKDYVDTLGEVVDIWEVGNEINGEWLFGSTADCSQKVSVSATSQADVVTKMTEAYDYVKSRGKVAALTLYYNAKCGGPPANEMFTWAEAHIPTPMRMGLDYLLVSYYEVDCGGYRPDWQQTFERLAVMFPKSKLGFSEFGWSDNKPPEYSAMKGIIRRTYDVHPNIPNWIGGGFYWEFAQDMVPYDPSPDSLWTTIDTALANQK